jgi:hypothetical protein
MTQFGPEGAPGEPVETIPVQLWQGTWTPADDQPVDGAGRYRPMPPPPPPPPDFYDVLSETADGGA